MPACPADLHLRCAFQDFAVRQPQLLLPQSSPPPLLPQPRWRLAMPLSNYTALTSHSFRRALPLQIRQRLLNPSKLACHHWGGNAEHKPVLSQPSDLSPPHPVRPKTLKIRNNLQLSGIVRHESDRKTKLLLHCVLWMRVERQNFSVLISCDGDHLDLPLDGNRENKGW